MNALEYIFQAYKIDKNEGLVHKTGRSREGSLAKLYRKLGHKIGAEIGVERGIFSKRICIENPQAKLYAIDAWQVYDGYRTHVSQDKLDFFLKRTKLRLKPYNCEVVKSFSVDASRRFEDESLDFIYLDAAHDYKSVKEDIEAWVPKVRIGGAISGHDYYNEVGRAGKRDDVAVKLVVDEWIEKNYIKHLFIFDKRTSPSWLYIKE